MPTQHAIPVWIALLGSGIMGALLAVQSRINGGIGQELGDGYIAATISFLVGIAITLVGLLFSRRGRAGFGLVRVELSSGRLPFWVLLGGVCGAFFVLGQTIITPVLGVALFMVAFVAGQVVGGLVFDRMGLGPGGRVEATTLRVLGTVLVIVAVVLTVLADLAGPGSHGAAAWLMIVPVVAGVGSAWQAAVNGLLRAAAHSALTTTLISFSVGAVFVVLAAIASVALQGWPEHWPASPILYLGGSLGVVFIALSAILVRSAGVLLLGMANVVGQLIASIALEAWLPLAGGVTAGLVLGTALALVAVVVAAIPRGSRARD